VVALKAHPGGDYLGADSVIDHGHPAVREVAERLWARANGDPIEFARLAYELARDEIAHAWDAGDRRVTVSASETLREGVGLCFAKAHLLTALLRARGIPAGLCYQRLTDDARHHQVHGLSAVYLRGRWHRQDPRGNTLGVQAEFSLGTERLAWPVRPELGELDYPEIYVRPHPAIVFALRAAEDALRLCAGGLPEAL
jgi:transglutaminase-like putative cysteine protease